MIRLVYRSRARPGVDDATALMILERARIANRANGLTGLLVFDGAHFLQSLEGEDAQVGATYARIRHDPRHVDCVTLDHGAIAARAFPGWDMAWRRVTRFEEPGALGETVASLVDPLGDGALAALFRDFATPSRTRP